MTDLLAKYKFDLTSNEIDHIIKNVEGYLSNWIDNSRLTKCLNCIDLTSLHSADTPAKIKKMAEKVNKLNETFPDYPKPASICVYPNFAETVKSTLTGSDVHVTVVGGCFPASQSFLEVKVLECKKAVEEGADEVDIVLALNKFLAKDYEGAFNEIKTIKEAIGDKTLKVILETGALLSIESIAAASFLAMEAGADFIKTSTGKLEPSATPMAAIVMCQAIKLYYQKTGRKVGFKPAGGISTCEEAIAYYMIVDNILGEEWLNKGLFRIGASRLANNILSKLQDSRVSYF